MHRLCLRQRRCVTVVSMRIAIPLLLACVALTSSLVRAECIAIRPVYMQLKVLSCSASYPDAVSRIDVRKYSPAQLDELKTSASYVSVVDVQALSYVDIINVNSKTGTGIYRGEIHAIAKDDAKRKLMLSGVPLDDCEKYYRGKTSLFAVQEDFACCRDVGLPGGVETSAQCLIKRPLAGKYGLELDALAHAKIQLVGKR